LPPGIGIILYGTVGEVSIGRLFAAGLFVGLFLMVVFMIAVRITAKRLDYKPETIKMATAREILGSLKETIWALLFPIMLLVGIRFGVFSVSEIGAFAVFYALFVGLFVYRVLNVKNFLESLNNAVIDIGAIMFIIAMSGIFGYGIPFERVPQRITDAFLGVTTEPILLLFLIVGFLFLIGLFVEGSVLIILLTPIFLPLVRSVGIDPIVFGMIFCTTITASLNTPPVGISMFAVNSILGASMTEYLRHSLPWLLVVLITLTTMILFPQAVLVLPNFFFG
jgi:tripartite ATP-independent transporter DctM subunit